ncbi:hypothetical protein P43SY_011074 [Pythium insidiosum]|uniref:Retrotransposon gag domain-containing protein n=1 Tax=Pythium insidiosum TaxID=114742 RepID=A0AAD5Q5M7_PYTIN|nr:hypothetical protein P43SY_011074 [Pythium insidiosum]
MVKPLFLQQAKLYFSAKCIDVDAPENQERLIAMVASNLKSQAAAWYTFYQGKFDTVNELATAVQAEFVPPDLQERLRGELLHLKQSRCVGLEDYIARFRQIICEVQDMSTIDQITWRSQLHSSTNVRIPAWGSAIEIDAEAGTASLEGRLYKDLTFTEYDLPTSHDLILGKPWLTVYNPLINWQTHAIELPAGTAMSVPHDMSDVDAPSNSGASTDKHEWQYYHVKVKAAVENEEPNANIKALLDEFADVFPAVLPTGLPSRRDVEFEIELKPDARPSTRAPFRLSKTEQDALQLFVIDLVEKQWIEVSNSPWVSNVFAIPKKDPPTGKMPTRSEWIRRADAKAPVRWVVDYRYLNSQTHIPKIPLPNIEDLFDKMARAEVYTVIDLAQGYHQMQDEDDHIRHLRAVFEVLQREKLYARLSKCTFGRESVDFLGHTISNQGLHVGAKKTLAIEQWQRPRSVKELHSLMGLASYYRRFIHRFADIVLPLSDLIKKDRKWEWGPFQENAFLVI